ncbi:hypothetical protein Bbelb_093320 [Branchiostoma belcheri]|nr:hypothetical protein Bbelb_093320 [Branchiostoma belcheri]
MGYGSNSEVFATCDDQATQPIFLSHGIYTGFSTVIISEVFATCDEQAAEPIFQSHGIVHDPNQQDRYVFSLTSSEVCARHAQCKQVDRCTCKMDDGSGNLNLHSFNRPEKALEIAVPGGTVYYNPCVGKPWYPVVIMVPDGTVYHNPCVGEPWYPMASRCTYGTVYYHPCVDEPWYLMVLCTTTRV